MAVTILEELSKEKPCGGHLRVYNASLEPVYRFVKRHLSEIEEARTRGYAWKQIEAACRKLWTTEEAGTDIVWWKTQNLIGSCYSALKKGTVVKSTKPRQKALLPTKFKVEISE